MSVRRKGGGDINKPAMPSSPTTAKESGNTSQVQTGKDAKPSTLAQMVRGMQQARYSDGQVKQKKEEKFQKLSDGRTPAGPGKSESTQAQQHSPMQALFLAAGADLTQRDMALRIDRDERRKVQLEEFAEEVQMDENTEETMANKVSQMGGSKAKPGKMDLAAVQTSLSLALNQGDVEVKEASKNQSVDFKDENAEVIASENTFGFVDLGETNMFTPGGKEIEFHGKDVFEIHQPSGESDEVEIRGDKVIITDDYGEEVIKPIPVSLILDDGTKLTIGPGGEVGVTNRQLFAQVSNGMVERNNRSTLSGGLKEELMEQGLSEEEAIAKLEQAGKNIQDLVPEDLNLDDLAQFNAADLDYLFRDGSYLVRNAEGAWTTNPADASPAAREAMREGRLMDTVWRMGGFCEEVENVLLDYLEQAGF